MLEFKKIELQDISIIKKYENTNNEHSCESSFVNLLIWQKAYNNMYAVSDNQLIIKSTSEGKDIFRLPFGNDFEKGIELIREYSKQEYPDFWVQEGFRFNELKEYLGRYYSFLETRDSFDYIYSTENLSQLSGKKYHSKRNHIAAFSKVNSWNYCPIIEENLNEVLICAEKWYAENSFREDKFLLCEKEGINTILNNINLLSVKGGLIYIDGKVVAFTLGSPINNETFDIHIEKALEQYKEAYAVINNQFALNELSNYKYINREDDMGLEGLRKAKLSYKPEIILKKYKCIARNE